MNMGSQQVDTLQLFTFHLPSHVGHTC